MRQMIGRKVIGLTVGLAVGLPVTVVPVAPAFGADSVPSAPPAAVLAPAPLTAGTPPTAAGVSARLGKLVKRQLKGASVLVVDPATGGVLFNQKGARPRIPASTVKLATAAAALDVLGPATTLPTIAYRDDKIVYLVGGGDPTLARKKGGNPQAGGRPSLTELAKAVAADYGTQTAVQVIYDASLFDGPGLGPGWSKSYPKAGVVAPVSALVVDGGRVRPGARSRVQDPARQAADVFASLLKSEGLKVRSVKPGPLDAAAAEVARVESASIADIVERMLTDSENDYAEALAHLVGGKSLGRPNFAGGAEATIAALQKLGMDTTGMRLSDGSGLSRRDLVPATALASILTAVVKATDPDISAIATGLPIAGLTGTLSGRFATSDTKAGRGFVHAKTGTLTGVTSLAGTVLDATGRTLVFVMLDDKAKSISKTRGTMDTVASRLAGCGCT